MFFPEEKNILLASLLVKSTIVIDDITNFKILHHRNNICRLKSWSIFSDNAHQSICWKQFRSFGIYYKFPQVSRHIINAVLICCFNNFHQNLFSWTKIGKWEYISIFTCEYWVVYFLFSDTDIMLKSENILSKVGIWIASPQEINSLMSLPSRPFVAKISWTSEHFSLISWLNFSSSSSYNMENIDFAVATCKSAACSSKKSWNWCSTSSLCPFVERYDLIKRTSINQHYLHQLPDLQQSQHVFY